MVQYVDNPTTGLSTPVVEQQTFYSSAPYQFSQIVTQSPGFYDTNDVNSAPSILPLQVATSAPSLPTLQEASNMLSSDQSVRTRLAANFDPEIFDLTDTSHLSRFMKVLLGDAGVGQLRKQSLVNRLSTVLESTHFYDLDGFYGALLSASRKPDEVIPLNPSQNLATEDEWDDIMARDSRYRERLIKMVKALAIGGTAQGLKALAEALTNSPCDISETWKLIPEGYSNGADNTWGQVEANYPLWGDLDGASWAVVSNHHQIGWEGIESSDEVTITVFNDYSDISDPNEQQKQKLRDTDDLLRVLGIFKPAGVILSVALGGDVNTMPVPIASMSADSEYWSITQKIYPKSTPQGTSDSPIFGTLSGDGQGLNMPVPPFSGSQQYEWFANASISVIDAVAWPTSVSRITGDQGWHRVDLSDRHGWPHNFEIIDYYTPGSTSPAFALTFAPNLGVVDPQVLAQGQAANNSRIVADPYAIRTSGASHA